MIRSFRGMYDHLPETESRHRAIVSMARGVASLYGYDAMATPIFEYLEVFARTLGETSDVVTKEMCTFKDSHNDTLVLRPEGTTGIMRAAISNKLTQEMPLKYFYSGPMFRYECPQKVRCRQFHQIGVEFLGESAPGADIEVIALGTRILKILDIKEPIDLHINTLGDKESQESYRKLLVEYFSDTKGELSEGSQKHLEVNPLRILNSKNEGDRAVVEKAPHFKESLNNESKDFFAKVIEGLDDLQIPYILNERLVKGLDYYCHTAFEFVSDSLGTQNAILTGGRYDGLAESMGSKAPIPSVGWAASIERLAIMRRHFRDFRPVVIVPIGEQAEKKAIMIAEDLRDKVGMTIIMSHKGNLKSRMQYANKVNAQYAVLIGDDELKKGVAIVRELDQGDQKEVPMDQLKSHIRSIVVEIVRKATST